MIQTETLKMVIRLNCIFLVFVFEVLHFFQFFNFLISWSDQN